MALKVINNDKKTTSFYNFDHVICWDASGDVRTRYGTFKHGKSTIVHQALRASNDSDDSNDVTQTGSYILTVVSMSETHMLNWQHVVYFQRARETAEDKQTEDDARAGTKDVEELQEHMEKFMQGENISVKTIDGELLTVVDAKAIIGCAT